MGVETIDKIFDEDGIIKRLKPSYFPRESQIAAAKKVSESIDNSENIIIEGPCGFGKTFAYLVPVFDSIIQRRIQNRELSNSYQTQYPEIKALVVTNGISLQEQLTKIDAPFVSKVLHALYPEESPIKTAIFKGKQNFLCKRKLMMYFSQAVTELNDEEKANEFTVWVDKTEAGDLSELSFILNSYAQSYCVCQNPDECEGSKCPYREECYYNIHKQKAAASDIIVCNYHMLFTAFEVPVLPEFNILVMDEAHEAPNILRDFMKTELNYNTINKLSKDLSMVFSNDILSEWVEDLPQSRRNEIFCGEVSDYKNPTKSLITRILSATDHMMSDAVKHTSFNMLALYPETYVSEKGFEFMETDAMITLLKLLLSCISVSKEFAEKFEGKSEDEDSASEISKVKRQLQSIEGRVQKYIQMMDASKYDENNVYFIEKKITPAKSTVISIGTKPITVGEQMSRALFSNTKIQSSIITSATLSVNEKFDYIKSELGLDLNFEETENVKTKPLQEFIGKSPFDLKNQELWYLPPYAVDGNAPQFDGYLEQVAEEITETAKGGILFLTTSIKLMNICYAAVRNTCLKNRLNINVLMQGDMPRLKLLQTFKDDENSILVATKSFFTGVDIPGNSLRCLVIDKFPFASPDDPVMKKLSAQPGGFFKYSIPSMVILLKQAVGRGVRSISDKCVICVADGRMATARYRASIHKSFSYEKTATRDINDVRRFLNGEG